MRLPLVNCNRSSAIRSAGFTRWKMRQPGTNLYRVAGGTLADWTPMPGLSSYDDPEASDITWLSRFSPFSEMAEGTLLVSLNTSVNMALAGYVTGSCV